MAIQLSKEKFGPWALVTGASAGIGKEFAVRLAAQGFNLVLVARRVYLLQPMADELMTKYSIQTRVIGADLAGEDFLAGLRPVTDDLDIGLVVSNAGLAQPGEFVQMKIDQLEHGVRINVLSHLILSRHYGERLVTRKRGGLAIYGQFGGDKGVCV